MPGSDTSASFRLVREAGGFAARLRALSSRWWARWLMVAAALAAIGYALLWLLVLRNLPDRKSVV